MNRPRGEPAPQLDAQLRKILGKMGGQDRYEFTQKIHRWSRQLRGEKVETSADPVMSLPPGHPDNFIDAEVRGQVMGLPTHERRELALRFMRWAGEIIANADRLDREAQKQPSNIYSRN